MRALAAERLSFESFVVGPGNRLAAAAAQRVAQAPGASYNPLVVYGAPGLGKTHLLHAIRGLALRLRPDAAVRYEPTAAFVDAVSAALAGDLEGFRAGYDAVDLLLLDDLQALAGAARTQEELLRLWQHLAPRGAQWVLTSDRPPAEVDGLDERLLARLSAGLMVDVAPPDAPTRSAIVRRRARERGAELQPGVAEALGALAFDNVRELQGALQRVLAVQEREARPVEAAEVLALLEAAPMPASAADEFGAFLEDVAQTVAEVVETGPWRRQLGEAILRWEAEGIRTRRLEAALEADSAPDVPALLAGFEADVARLRQLAAELHARDAALARASAALLADPDALAAVEQLAGGERREPPAPAAPVRPAAPPPPASARPGAPTEDAWFRSREKFAWDWTALAERLPEELG